MAEPELPPQADPAPEPPQQADAAPALSADEQALLDALPPPGETRGNIHLRRDVLHWADARYWDARASLIQKNLVTVLRGRGGAVARVAAKEPEPEPAPPAAPEAPPAEPRGGWPEGLPNEDRDRIRPWLKEESLWDPIRTYLDAEWTRSMGFSQALVAKTANQGRRITGGTWTQPDLVAIGLLRYKYLPTPVLEVATFEVKAFFQWDARAVFEAVAHSRFATQSWVVIHMPLKPANEHIRREQEFERLVSECRRFGIGLALLADPNDQTTYRFEVEPIRRDPDPELLEEFIDTQLPDRAAVVQGWLAP